jgi:hypothetical protein
VIVDFPVIVFLLGAIGAYGSAGWRRQAATIVMLLGAAWSLALLVEPGATLWLMGPLVSTLMVGRPADRTHSTFEGLTRRAITIASLMVLALFLASRLPFGENPLLLNVVPWLLGAVGTAWMVSPIDAGERVQGQLLMVAATGALLLTAVPAGVVTAAAVGGTALLPVLAERGPMPSPWRSLLSSLMLAAAAIVALVAAAGVPLPRPAFQDLSISLGGPILLGVAVLLIAGAIRAPQGSEWVGLIGVVALIALAPSLRWSAIAALIASATGLNKAGERPAWVAVGALAAVPLLPPLAPPAWSARVQAVALAVGLVVMVYAARAGMLRVLALPAVGFLVLASVASLSSGNLTRFQWIVAVGALLLLSRAGIMHLRRVATPNVIIGDQLILGLTLLALSARDAPGLGALGAALLVINLALVRLDDLGAHASGFTAGLLTWARSNWPGSLTFAGGTVTVIAALQASLGLGLLAALLLAALQLAPLLDGNALAAAPERPQARVHWMEPALSIAFGIAPALMLRMLRL